MARTLEKWSLVSHKDRENLPTGPAVCGKYTMKYVEYSTLFVIKKYEKKRKIAKHVNIFIFSAPPAKTVESVKSILKSILIFTTE